MQSRTGVPISSMHMRGLGTSGVAGYVLVSLEAVTTSHTLITSLPKSHLGESKDSNCEVFNGYTLILMLLLVSLNTLIVFFVRIFLRTNCYLTTSRNSVNIQGYRIQCLINSFFHLIELKELEGALGSLPRKKSAGHNCILNEHLTHGGAAINDLLLSLFNSV